MDPYEQYLADLEFEKYQQSFNAQSAIKRSTPPPFAHDNELGADYNRSYGGVALEGVEEFIPGMTQFIGDTYNFVNPIAGKNDEGGIYDTIKRAGIERTAKTAGGISSGIAGAAAGAPVGAWLGALVPPLAPVTVPLGAAAGGAVGFASGMGLFDSISDIASDIFGGNNPLAEGGYTRPMDQYMKDAVYNTTQGFVGGAPIEAARAFRASRANPSGLSRAETRVVDRLNELEPGLQGKIDQGFLQELGDPLLSFKSTGELIDSPALKNAQRASAKTSIESYGRKAQADRLRDSEHLKWLNDLEQSPMTVDEVQSGMREAIEQRAAASQRGISEAEMGVDQAISDLPPSIDPSEAGAMMREGAEASLKSLKAKQKEAFGNTGQGIIDPAPALAVAEAALPEYFREVGNQPNPKLVTLVEQLRAPSAVETGLFDAAGKPITRPQYYSLKDIQAMRSDALDIAQSGDRSASVAGKIADALRKSGDEAVSQGIASAEEVASWKEGLRLRKEQGAKYESSALPAKSILAKQPYGEYRIAESAVPSKVWRKGDKGVAEGIDNYRDVVGRTETQLEPLYRYATDKFREYVVKDGKVNSAKYNQWMKDHRVALDKVPELRERLSNVGKAQKFLEERYGDLKRSAAESEVAALKYFIDADPEVAIKKMLAGDDAIKKTTSLTNYLTKHDPDAVAGLRRGIFNHLKKLTFIDDGKVTLEEAAGGDAPFDGTVRGGTFKREYERIRPALEKSKILTDSQLKGLDMLYRDRSSSLSVGKAVIQDGSGTAQNQSAFASLLRIGKKGFLRSLPGGRYWEMVEPILQKIPEVEYMNKLEEALLNPLYARDLMQKATQKNLTKAVDRIFGDKISEAFGDTTKLGALASGAKTVAPLGAAAASQNEPEAAPTAAPRPRADTPPAAPKQSKVTSTQSMPQPSRLLNPDPEARARQTVESSNNPWAVSPKGAQGQNQIMPETGKWIASKLGETYKPLREGMTLQEQQQAIEQNNRFADWYFKYLMGKFKNNTTLARAAYNAGEGRIDNAIKRSNGSTNPRIVLNNLPAGVKKETIPYVNRMSEVIRRYQ